MRVGKNSSTSIATPASIGWCSVQAQGSILRGFDGGGVRAPLQELSVDETRELEACLEPLG